MKRLARTVYSRATSSRALRGPLDVIRSHPRVRAFARRHVQVLLTRGTTWANVDGALRLLAEDPGQQIVFGPWRGDAAAELLYWAPFVRWAQEHFALDPARVTVVSRGAVGHWYGIACGAYADADDLDDRFSSAAVFSPGPVLALIEEYRSGSAAPRPLLKRSKHVLLPFPDDPVVTDLPDVYVALALEPSPAFPASEANERTAKSVIEALSGRGPVASLEQATTLRAQHALLSGASGLVAAYSGLALLGAFSGIPVIALRSTNGDVAEPDLDLAQRITSALGGSLTIVDAADLETLKGTLGGSTAQG